MNFTYIPQKTDGLLKSLALNDLKSNSFFLLVGNRHKGMYE